jgi:hypothetical protein
MLTVSGANASPCVRKVRVSLTVAADVERIRARPSCQALIEEEAVVGDAA